MVLAEVSPSGDGGMGIVELLKAKRGGKSLPCGDDQLAVVAEAMVGDGTSAATLRENIGDASMVDVVSPYFATAMGRDTLPPFPQAILRAWWLGAAQTGGALQVARSASALPGRVASAPAAEEESALTEVQVAELAKQNLSSTGALALSVSLLTGYVVTAMDLASGDRPSRAQSSAGTCGQSSYRERDMLAEASLILEFSSGLGEFTEDKQFFDYIQRYFRKLPLDRIVRDDVYREHERSVESFEKELAELAKRVTKAEAASAEAQRTADEAKRSGNAGEPKVKKGN
ncbi:hypothetical protein EMIHUDRAFT_193947 [Emiliania huxleyi CCMP1516]|uniref:Uncharacterized protein n=2 Tax=Emiliania huxleyi TaxID=2903 RepID=A0A0D3L0P3_EMIH1|nr:hypothetical protein EMIHUDRAFT_193947 [Emiliania huxleyi CCMP1516]EOD41578.1 hypothetical protein EMIHUDRAFT_193947 [Emiliania huxleyi CCMP1516]|eukprot:XP_005794007.1 hypothetical protein EMIHUDRAFT_193947 [Emiliania huxleyi CCMP1516]